VGGSPSRRLSNPMRSWNSRAEGPSLTAGLGPGDLPAHQRANRQRAAGAVETARPGLPPVSGPGTGPGRPASSIGRLQAFVPLALVDLGRCPCSLPRLSVASVR
jgi:hypothetical protein